MKATLSKISNKQEDEKINSFNIIKKIERSRKVILFEILI